MKIAFIGQKGLPALSGGVERRVEELSIRMTSEGHEIFVYVRDNYTNTKLKKYKGVNLIHLPSISTKHLDTISHTFLATIHALFQNYDVINYQAPGPSSLCWIIKALKRKTALIATFNCKDQNHHKWGWFARKYLLFGEYVINRVPDKTIVVSKLLKDYAQKKYGTDPMVITNGAKIGSNVIANIIKKWDLKEKKYIIYIGRLVKHKGVHYLIKAFKQLEDTNKLPNNFKLVIVGGGSFTDDYVEYLKLISAKRKNIILTGNQTGDALEGLLSNAYLFVQPSEVEGLSISLLESMGHGVASLVSDIAENMEPVKNTGFSFKSKDAKDLHNKLAYLINKPYEVSIAGKAAKEIAIKEHSWDSITQKYLQVYRDLVNKKDARYYVWNSRKI